jgi:hypothetical protein
VQFSTNQSVNQATEKKMKLSCARTTILSYYLSPCFLAAPIVDAAIENENSQHTTTSQHQPIKARWHWPWDMTKNRHYDIQKDTEEALSDEIDVLPGWNRKLPSRMFSGYVDAGTAQENGVDYTMHEHYFFVESEGDPMTDPLIVWTNGEF